MLAGGHEQGARAKTGAALSRVVAISQARALKRDELSQIFDRRATVALDLVLRTARGAAYRVAQSTVCPRGAVAE